LPEVSSIDQHSCTMSSRILSARSANALIKLPSKTAQKSCIDKGEIVEVIIIGPIT
uniref:MoeA_C domain-containing protein n=1 Tax=Dracunculus medinensis TaxID=318479 RepID=A0A0N4USD6_DRAME